MNMGFLQQNKENNQKYKVPLVDNNFTHALCIGETGCGKTSGFILPNIKSRISKQHGVLVFDFKGNLNLQVKQIAREQNRLKDIIELGTPWGAKTNLLKNMSHKEIYDLLLKTISAGVSDKEVFWYRSAAHMGLSIARVLLAAEKMQITFAKQGIDSKDYIFGLNQDSGAYPSKFAEKIERHEEENGTSSKTQEILGMIDNPHPEYMLTYPTSPSFKTLEEITSNLTNFINYIKATAIVKKVALRRLLDAFTIEQKLDANATEADFKNHLKKKFFPAYAAYKMFINECKELRQYEAMKYTEADSASGQYGVFMTLSSVTSRIDAGGFFSTNDTNILKELEDGKIVILQTSLLSSAAVNTFFSSILLGLSKRAKLGAKRAISIFVDEAFRVIDQDTEIAGDILRESKVELIFAIQNEAQLMNKIGKNAYEELKGHLTQRFIFRNNAEQLNDKFDTPTKQLSTHEYIIEKTETSHHSVPLFFDIHMLMQTEKLFQKATTQLSYADNHVAVFSDVMYENHRQIYLYDITTSNYKVAAYIDKKQKEEMLSDFDVFLRLHSQHNGREHEFAMNINSKHDIWL